MILFRILLSVLSALNLAIIVFRFGRIEIVAEQAVAVLLAISCVLLIFGLARTKAGSYKGMAADPFVSLPSLLCVGVQGVFISFSNLWYGIFLVTLAVIGFACLLRLRKKR